MQLSSITPVKNIYCTTMKKNETIGKHKLKKYHGQCVEGKKPVRTHIMPMDVS